MGLPSYGALGARIALRFATCFQTGILILALAFTIFPVTILYHFRLYMSIGFAKLFWQFRDNKTAPISEGGISYSFSWCVLDFIYFPVFTR